MASAALQPLALADGCQNSSREGKRNDFRTLFLFAVFTHVSVRLRVPGRVNVFSL